MAGRGWLFDSGAPTIHPMHYTHTHTHTHTHTDNIWTNMMSLRAHKPNMVCPVCIQHADGKD